MEKINSPNSSTPRTNFNLLEKVSLFLSTAGIDDHIGCNSLEILAALSLLRKLAYTCETVQKCFPFCVALHNSQFHMSYHCYQGRCDCLLYGKSFHYRLGPSLHLLSCLSFSLESNIVLSDFPSLLEGRRKIEASGHRLEPATFLS